MSERKPCEQPGCGCDYEKWFDAYCKEREITGLQAYEEVKRLHPVTFIHDDWMNFYLGKNTSQEETRRRIE